MTRRSCQIRAPRQQAHGTLTSGLRDSPSPPLRPRCLATLPGATAVVADHAPPRPPGTLPTRTTMKVHVVCGTA